MLAASSGLVLLLLATTTLATTPDFLAGIVDAAGDLPVQSAVQSAVFQNGIAGYMSTREVSINTQYYDAWNNFNGGAYGVPWAPFTQLGGFATVHNLTSFSSGAFRVLVRFDDIGSVVPAGATVLSARLTQTFQTWQDLPVIVRGKYLTANWTWDQRDQRSSNKGVGWRYRQANGSNPLPWKTPGALEDTVPNAEFQYHLRSLGDQTKEVDLDPSIVQTWLNQSTNFGVILFSDHTVATRKAALVSISHNASEYRPLTSMLSLTYRPASVALPTPTPVEPLAFRNRTVWADAVLGNDNWNGDASRPVKSVYAAVALAKPGDTIYLRSGVYGGASISQTDTTLSSAPGHWAVITASTYDPTHGTALFVRDTAHRFVLRNVEVVGGFHYALATFSSWQFSGTMQEQEAKGATGPVNLLIEDCRLHGSGSSVVKLTVATVNATIRRCEIFNSGRRVATYGHGIEMVNNRGGRIEDNYIHDVFGAGVKMSGGCKDVLLQRNVITKAHLAGLLLGFYENTEYMDWTSNRKWYECIRCSAVSNIISSVNGAGIGLYASKDSFVAHNTLFSTAHTMMSMIVLSSVQHWENSSTLGSPMTGNANPTLRNNIVVKGRLGRRGNMHLQVRQGVSWGSSNPVVSALEPGTTFSSQYNAFFAIAMESPQVFKWGDGVMLEDERLASAFVGNVSGFRANTSWEVGSIEADPYLDDAFYPAPCSEVADFAPILTANPNQPTVPLTDFDGNAFAATSGKVTVGARQLPDAATRTVKSFPSMHPEWAATAPFTGKGLNRGSNHQWPYYPMLARSAKTFYVSPVGVDSTTTASGNLTHPFKSTNFAQLQMWPGDTLQLRNGTYPKTLDIWLPNITIESYPGEWATISVSNSDSNIANAVYFADWNNFGGSGEVTLRRIEIVGGYYYGVMFNQIGGGTSNAYWNWYKQETGQQTKSVTVLEDLVIHGSGSHLIKLSPEANDVVFRRLRLYRAGRRGDNAAAVSPTPQTPGNPETARATQATEAVAAGNGIDVRGSHRLTIEDCHISDISGTGILLGGGSQDSVIQRNLLENIGTIGILVGSFNTEAMYMRLVENPSLFQAVRTIVRNNIVANVNGAGLGLYSSKGTIAAHNTFYNVSKTMQAALLFNIAPVFSTPTTELLPPNEDATIVNNIFHQVATATGVHAGEPCVDLHRPGALSAVCPWPSQCGGLRLPRAAVGAGRRPRRVRRDGCQDERPQRRVPHLPAVEPVECAHRRHATEPLEREGPPAHRHAGLPLPRWRPCQLLPPAGSQVRPAAPRFRRLLRRRERCADAVRLRCDVRQWQHPQSLDSLCAVPRGERQRPLPLPTHRRHRKHPCRLPIGRLQRRPPCHRRRHGELHAVRNVENGEEAQRPVGGSVRRGLQPHVQQAAAARFHQLRRGWPADLPRPRALRRGDARGDPARDPCDV